MFPCSLEPVHILNWIYKLWDTGSLFWVGFFWLILFWCSFCDGEMMILQLSACAVPWFVYWGNKTSTNAHTDKKWEHTHWIRWRGRGSHVKHCITLDCCWASPVDVTLLIHAGWLINSMGYLLIGCTLLHIEQCRRDTRSIHFKPLSWMITTGKLKKAQ